MSQERARFWVDAHLSLGIPQAIRDAEPCIARTRGLFCHDSRLRVRQKQ